MLKTAAVHKLIHEQIRYFCLKAVKTVREVGRMSRGSNSSSPQI